MKYRSYSPSKHHTRPKKFKRRRREQPSSFGRENPYRKRPTQRGPLRTKAAGVLFLLTMAAWILLLIYHPFFFVEHVMIRGAINVDEIQVADKIKSAINKKKAFILPSQSYFFIDNERISTVVKASFPVDEVSIEKHFPSSISVTLQERLSFIIYDDGQHYSLIDESGNPLRNLRAVAVHETLTRGGEEEGTPTSTAHYPDIVALANQFGNYPTLYDISGRENQSRGVVDSDIAKAVLTISTYLKENTNFATHHFIIPPELKTLIVEHKDGIRVSFNPSDNLPAQLDTFKQAWLKELQVNTQYGTLINARYDGKVYVEDL